MRAVSRSSVEPSTSRPVAAASRRNRWRTVFSWMSSTAAVPRTDPVGREEHGEGVDQLGALLGTVDGAERLGDEAVGGGRDAAEQQADDAEPGGAADRPADDSHSPPGSSARHSSRARGRPSTSTLSAEAAVSSG